jgi:hypothetical protein
MALAVVWMIATTGSALAQYEMMPPGGMAPPGAPGIPPGAVMMGPGGPMMPGGQTMMHPGGAMMPPGGAMMPPGGAMMPPGGQMMMSPGGPMLMGGYPGMAPVMPYPPPMDGGYCCGDGRGGAPCGCFGRHGGCGEDACHGRCCEGACEHFGRGGGCGEGFCEGGDGTPHWRGRVEAVYLTFTLPDEPILADNANGEAALGVANLLFDYEFNGRIAVEGRLPCDHSLEVVFMGFVHWADKASATDPAGLQSIYQTLDGLNAVAYDNALLQEIAYSSEFYTFEANYWLPIMNSPSIQLSFMSGARYLRIDEDFVYTSLDANGLSGRTDINALNNIGALQMGAMCWAPLNRRVSIRIDAKAGTAYNVAQQTTAIAVTGFPNYNEKEKTNKGVLLAETSGVIMTQLNCHVGIYVGYQALYLDELVLAPEQFNPVFPTAGFRPVTINDTGHRLYHGAMAGVEITW